MTYINFAEAELDAQYAPGTDSSFDVIMADTNDDLTDQLTGSTIAGGGRFTIIHSETKQKFRGEWSSIADLTARDGLSRYTATIALADDGTTKMIGLANTGDGTNAVSNVIADNISGVSTIPQGSKVYFSAVGAEDYNRLEAQVLGATTTNSLFVAGEAISERDSVSIHTNNKIYKYHATNYPSAVGIANADYAIDETVTYIAEGGSKTGFSSLTINEIVYADNTGVVTQTNSATTSIIGRAESDTIVRVKLPAGDLVLASDAEVTAGVGTGVTNVTQAKTMIDSFGASSVDDLIIKPVIYQNPYGSNLSISSNTFQYVALFEVTQKITINSVGVLVNLASTPGDIKFAIFSSDGQSILMQDVFSFDASTGVVVKNLSVPYDINPGQYYIGWLAVGSSNIRFNAFSRRSDLDSYKVYCGYQSVTANTIETFNPSVDLTSSDAGTFLILS